MILLILFCIMTAMTASAQEGRHKYEFMRNLPVYADSLIADMTYPLAWGNSDIKDFDEWKRAAQQKVFDCMLTPPPPPASGYDVKILSEEQRDGYKARKIEIRLSRYYTVPAYVLIPDGKGPFPAINVLHDHGAHLFIGKEKMIRPLACEDSTVIKDAEAWSVGYEGQFFGDYLAQHGYVVFSADAPMWGERGQKEGPRRDRYDMIAGNMMMYGIDLSAYMTYDDIAGTEFLATMPEVDANHIGCTGWSMGGYRAWMLSALSDRIKAGASVCWMATTDEQMSFKYSRTENGGFANCYPGLRRWLDYPHVASIACPKPMLFINGSQDKLFPVPSVEKAFKIMHNTWNSQGADNKLETELWDMPHSCGKKSQKRVLDFFDKHLKDQHLIDAAHTNSPVINMADGVIDTTNYETAGLVTTPGIKTVTIFKAGEQTDHYANGVVMTAFKGKLYCMWQSSPKDEDSDDTWVAYSISSDDGNTWSKPKPLALPTKDYYCTSGGWLVRGDTLTAFIDTWQKGLEPRGGKTSYITSIDGQTWNQMQPVRMADGNVMEGVLEQDPYTLPDGRLVGAAHFMPGLHVCPVFTDDPRGVSGWRKGQFEAEDLGKSSREIEPSQYMQPDGTIVMLFRDQTSSFRKLASISTDRGETWTSPTLTNFPDGRTKQCAGNLPTSAAYMVSCPANGKRRWPLVLQLSDDGRTFDKAILLRSGSADDLPPRRYEGRYKTLGYSYPKATIWKNHLYICYSTNKEDVECTIVPLALLVKPSFKKMRMCLFWHILIDSYFT